MIFQKNLIGQELSSEIIEATATRHDFLVSSLNLEPSAQLLRNEKGRAIFPTFFLGSLINFTSIQKTLELNVKNILHSRESINSWRVVEVGDVIQITTFLQDAYEKQATLNPIGFIVLEFVGSIRGDFVFHGERIWAIRGGFERRKN